MSTDENIKLGESLFYFTVKLRPLTITEKVAVIIIHEEFGYHDDTYLYFDVIGESGERMWSYYFGPNCSLEEEMRVKAMGEYLSDMFSCRLEVRIKF